ncbi:MAG: CNNM domain-containing protein, partial [Ignavibacteriaceae bacterium]|nr:CNNM domain-containing protein [Ignavibacteriaceae bacterium]
MYNKFMALLFLYLALALVVSFLCSIAEAVILSVSAPFIKMKEMEGKVSAKHLKNLKSKIDRPLSAILTINTVAHTVGAAGVGAQAVSVFGEIYFGLISAILTLLILFFSEIIPKTIGAVYWRKLAFPAAILIIGMIYLSYPLVIISEFITKIISKNKESQTMSREEVVALAHIGSKEGVLKESESKIIDNLIKLSSLKVRVIMTPRTVVVSAPEEISLDEFFKRSEYMKFSRIPVYSGNIDNVTGYILKADVLEKLAKDKHDQKLKDNRRPIIIFYENFSIPKLLKELIVKKEHLALIIDEHGGMQGIITMEDII